MNIVLMIVAYMLIYVGCDVARKPDSKIESGSWQWFLQVGLVTIGGTILYMLGKGVGL